MNPILQTEEAVKALMYFEVHITLPGVYDGPDAPRLIGLVAREHAAKVSCINGDPLLGPRIYTYLTFHDTDFERARTRMVAITAHLERLKLQWLRRKIEQVVLDERT